MIFSKGRQVFRKQKSDLVSRRYSCGYNAPILAIAGDLGGGVVRVLSAPPDGSLASEIASIDQPGFFPLAMGRLDSYTLILEGAKNAEVTAAVGEL